MKRAAIASRVIFSLLILSIFSGYSTPSYSQDPIAEDVVKVPQMLERDSKRFAAYIDEKTGTPTWIIDVDSLDFSLGDPRSFSSEASVAEAAQDFLTFYADQFGIHPDALSLKHISTRGDLWFLNYQQVYNGLPVLNSEVGVTATKSGRLIAAGVRAFPDLSLDVTPTLGSLLATRAAQSNIGLMLDPVDAASLIIVPIEQADRYDYKLAWQINLEDLAREEPISKTFYVDAHAGNIILEYSNILESSAHAHPIVPPSSAPASEESSSDALEQPNPLIMVAETTPSSPSPLEGLQASTSNSVWGYVKLNYYVTPNDYTQPLNRFTDQGFFDAKVVIKNNQTQQSYTTYANSSGYYSVSGLSSGSHTVTFEIRNSKAYINTGLSTAQKKKDFTINVSGSTQCDYDWNWGDLGDGGLTSYALNGVYHVRSMYDYFKNSYSYNGMDAITHDLKIYSGGTGSTNGVTISLGGTEAMSSEVTLHEYTHDVIYKLYGSFIKSGQSGQTLLEAGAMDEGFANYYPVEKTNDHTFGGPQANADPYAPAGNGVGVVFLYNTCTMNDFNGGWPCGGSDHSRGRIIAGTIYNIRSSIGGEAGQILFDAFQISPKPRTFEELRARYVSADNARNSGSNNNLIEQKFTDRYIGGPDQPGYPTFTLDYIGYPTVHWSDNSVVEDGYRVERKFNSGSWSVIANKPANSTSFTDNYKCNGGGSGTYYYRIQAYYVNSGNPDKITYSGTTSLDLATCYILKVAENTPTLEATNIDLSPVSTALDTAYPNPFNPSTTIRYTLAEEGLVQLTVYDVLGREVAVLTEGVQKSGAHSVDFDASLLPSGIYIYRLRTRNEILSGKMLLSK